MPNNLVPYNELKLLKDIGNVETIYLVKLAADAQEAIAVLNHELKKLPNPYVLLDSLLLQESKASSRIENIVTTNDELFKGIVLDDEKGIKEVLNYKNALFEGFKVIKEKGVFSIGDLIRINTKLTGSAVGLRKNDSSTPVRYTTISKIDSAGNKEVLYTPPHGEELLYKLLVDMLEYVYFDDLHPYHPLIKIALAHYQFECIHPFYDGNGRTGRILNILFMCQKGMLLHPVLYVSSYLLQYRVKYYELLQSTRINDDYEDVVAFMLRGFMETAQKTLAMIEKIENSINQFKEYVRENTVQLSHKTSQKVPEEVIALVYEKVYCRVSDLTDERKKRLGDIERPAKEPDKNAGKRKRAAKLPAHRETASLYLRALEKIGLLQSEKVNNTVIYKNTELIKLFETEEKLSGN
ncbi:MAG: Fic family protein [Clostridia bacterium]|nr:Fic family protein [Clostridia bacterium]